MKNTGNSKLFVVSAPSGGGKTTLCKMLLAELAGITYSISCTTRQPRDGEIDGRDYFFMDEPEFVKKKDAFFFIEHALVHGNWYGTSKEFVRETLATGNDILLDIDVQGAAQIRESAKSGTEGWLSKAYVDIFVSPPDLETLRRRIVGRALDTAEVIERRMKQAATEMEGSGQYQYSVINDKLEDAYDCFRAIVLAERCRQ
jgi:guanylate kinase